MISFLAFYDNWFQIKGIILGKDLVLLNDIFFCDKFEFSSRSDLLARLNYEVKKNFLSGSDVIKFGEYSFQATN